MLVSSHNNAGLHFVSEVVLSGELKISGGYESLSNFKWNKGKVVWIRGTWSGHIWQSHHEPVYFRFKLVGSFRNYTLEFNNVIQLYLQRESVWYSVYIDQYRMYSKPIQIRSPSVLNMILTYTLSNCVNIVLKQLLITVTNLHRHINVYLAYITCI